jgi:hypothetical protein
LIVNQRFDPLVDAYPNIAGLSLEII